MLVLARKENESIVIGDCVKVTIVEVSGGRVKLGIVAPDKIPVHREEIWFQVQKENQAATLSSANLVAVASGLLLEGSSPKRKPYLRSIQ